MPKRKPGRGGIHEKYGTWSINTKGYPRLRQKPYRNKYLHRVVWEQIAGKTLPDGWHVHHQDFNKMNWSGTNLIAMDAALNTLCHIPRCPFTGKFMTPDEFKRSIGVFDDEVPF